MKLLHWHFCESAFESGVFRASLVHKLETSTRPKSHMRQGGSMQDFLQLPPCLLHIFPLPEALLYLSTLKYILSALWKHIHIFSLLAGLFSASRLNFVVFGSFFFLISSSPSQSVFSLTYRIANWNLKLRKKNKNQNLKEKIAWSQLFGLYKAPRNNFSILSFLPQRPFLPNTHRSLNASGKFILCPFSRGSW